MATGGGYDDDRFQQTVSQNLKCVICMNVFKEPVMCRRNEHNFCCVCITRHLTNSNTCPTCKDQLTPDTLRPASRILKDWLAELNIRCDNFNRGCSEFIKLEHLQTHVVKCGFTRVVCSNEECHVEVNKRDLVHHESAVCEFRKVKCHECSKIKDDMATIARKLDGMEMNFGAVNEEMKEMKTNVAQVKYEMEEMNTNQTAVNDEMGEMNMQLSRVNERIKMNFGAVNEEMKEMKTNMAQVKYEMEEMNRNETALNNEMKEMKMNLTRVNEGIKMNFGAVKYEMNGNLMEIKQQLETTQHMIQCSQKENATEVIEEDKSRPTKTEHNIIIAGGGRTGKLVEHFSWSNQLWYPLQPMKESRDSSSSFLFNNEMIVGGGGWTGNGNTDSIEGLNVNPVKDTEKWINFPVNMPAKLRGHTSIVYNERLLLIGGLDERTVECSDSIHEVLLVPPFSTKLLTRMAQARWYHGAVLFGDQILICGGMTNRRDDDSTDSVVFLYDIINNECKQMPPLPYAVRAMATVKWGEHIVVIGGAGRKGEKLSSVVIYNVKSGNHNFLPEMKHKRRGCVAVVVGNCIVVMGGRDEKFNKLKSVERFNFNSFSWEDLPPMNEARYRATAVAW